jgi:putative ATPase
MQEPLAFRVRPATLDDVIGQQELVGPTGFLRKSVAKKALFSMILFGPPGTGKTTIAEAYAKTMKIHFEKIKRRHDQITRICKAPSKRPNSLAIAIIIMDEVHRFDKQKQDFFCPTSKTAPSSSLGPRPPIPISL